MKRGLMAAFVTGSMVLGVGCASEVPPTSSANVAKPSAAVKVSASLRTSKISGLKTWQVYNGFGHVAALGFDKKGKPVDGLRMVFADSSGAVKGIRFETVKGRRVLQLDARGEIVKNTMQYSDMRTLYGGFQVIAAFAKSGKAGTTAAKAMRPFADGCSLTDSLIDVGTACAGPIWCTGKALVTNKGRGAGQCWTGADTGTKVGCAGSVAPAAKCAAEKLGKALGGEDKAKKAADDAAQKASLDKDPASKDGSEKDPSADPTKDPNDPSADPNDPSADPNDPSADPNDPSADPNDPSAQCSDGNDPACDPENQSDPETNCVGDNDAACTGDESQDPNAEQDPTEDPDANNELDPNPDDPEESTQDDNSQEEPSQDDSTTEPSTPSTSEEGPIEASFRGGLHVASYKGSTSRSVAKRIGGACSANHVLQCGVRNSRAFCRCVKL